jgi:hypothetical protein
MKHNYFDLKGNHNTLECNCKPSFLTVKYESYDCSSDTATVTVYCSRGHEISKLTQTFYDCNYKDDTHDRFWKEANKYADKACEKYRIERVEPL